MQRITTEREKTIQIELTLTELLDIETAVLDKVGKLQKKDKWNQVSKYLKISESILKIANEQENTLLFKDIENTPKLFRGRSLKNLFK